MRGKEAINWIFDWLQQGSSGQNYEILPVVQPVVNVDGIARPEQYECWVAAAQNIINGTVTTLLPLPGPNFKRIWLQLWTKSTAGTAPLDSLDRLINNAAFTLADQPAAALVTFDVPLIGGMRQASATSAALMGLAPQISHAGAPLQHRHVDTVAAGTFVIRGCFIDVPLSSPVSSLLW